MRLWGRQTPERHSRTDRHRDPWGGSGMAGDRVRTNPQADTMGQPVLCLVPEEPNIRPLASLSFLPSFLPSRPFITLGQASAT